MKAAKVSIPGNLFQVFEAESCHWCSLMTTNAKKFAFGCLPWAIWQLQVQGTQSEIAFNSTFYQYVMSKIVWEISKGPK